MKSLFKRFARWILKTEIDFFSREASTNLKMIQEVSGDRDNAQYRVETLRKLVDEYKKRESILMKDRFTFYTTLPVPQNRTDLDSFDAFLGSLGKNKSFLLYLHTLENDILRQFTEKNGDTDSERHRGGLLLIRKIRTDLNDAAQAKVKANEIQVS
jgi:hypothetical protein